MRKHRAFGLVVAVTALFFASAALCVDSDGSSGSGQLGDDVLAAPEYNPPGSYTAPERPDDVPEAVPGYRAVDREYIGSGVTDKEFNAESYLQPTKVSNRDNGIVVGQPKLFELRSLQMMIDNVKASLAQTVYPNTSQLFAMTGRVQGGDVTSHEQVVDVTAQVGAGGSGGTRYAPQASVPRTGGPSTPDPASPSALAVAPTDVLAEQTSLWHQLVNLQMLLDGALSDRLIPTDENGSATVFGNSVKFSPRAQAIVGFQISVDSLEEFRNAVAEAIITIDNKRPSPLGVGGYGDEPSLMMLLPRSKTYNTISVSRDAKSFGFGSVVNVFSLGFAQEKKRETFYIGKDTDTVALERIPGLPVYGLPKPSGNRPARYRGVSFGWQFRPVFTRAAVEPGVRQVFAMISLPASVLEEKWEGKVHITTYWRRYNRATGAVGKPIESSVNEWNLDDVVVPIGSGVEEALEPRITKAEWEDAGGGNVAITMEGSNFSLGVAVAYGEVTLDEKNVSLFGVKRMRFVAPAYAVARGNVTIMGRYGMANLRLCAGNSDNPYHGVVASPLTLTQRDDQTTSVELTLSNVDDPARLVTGRRPVVELDGQLIGVGEKPFTSISADEAQKTLVVKFCAPSQALAKSGELVVRDLVGPAAFPVRCGVDEGGCIANKAVVLSTGSRVSVALFGTGFRDDVKVQVGDREVSDRKLNSSDGKATMITFDVDRETALDARYILVTQGSRPPILVPFSMSAEAAPRPEPNPNGR